MADTFRARVDRAWADFARKEADLRRLLQERKGEELIAAIRESLALCFTKINFEIAVGERIRLILALEASMPMLFEIAYFAHHIPEDVAEHWEAVIGRQKMDTPRIDARWLGEVIRAEDTFFRARPGKGPFVELEVWNRPLMKHWEEHQRGVRWMLGNMVDLAIGEAASMRFVSRFDVLTEFPEDGQTIDCLPQTLRDMGLDVDGEHLDKLVNGLRSYRMRPVIGAAVPLRGDISSGVTRLPGLLNGWATGDRSTFDDFARDGVAAGFLCWSIDGLGKDTLGFRNTLASYLQQTAGPDAFAYMGGAEGLKYGYLDFLAWDLRPVLDEAGAFFRKAGRPGRYVPFVRENPKPKN